MISRAPTAARPSFPVIRDDSNWRVTWSGWALFFIGLSLIGSGFTRFRYSVGGLLLHPYLAFVFILFPLLAASRLRAVPTKFTALLTLFAALYFVSTFAGGVSIGGGAKMGAIVATILVCAMLVRTRADFVMGITGMLTAMGALAFIGISSEDVTQSGSVSAIEASNRNTYSLYALSPLLLGAYILLRQSRESLITKGLLLVSAALVTLCIVINTNRSGWLGLGIIAVLMVYEQSVKAAIGFAFVAVALYFVATTMFNTEYLTTRAGDFGNQSDQVRYELFTNSIIIGIQNPLIGVSPQHLGKRLGVMIGHPGSDVEPHNVYALLIGGCGLLCFALFIAIGYEFWTWRPPRAAMMNTVDRHNFFEARKLLRYTIILYAIRGLFTAEILYSPSFNMAIGICMGLVISSCERAQNRAALIARRG